MEIEKLSDSLIAIKGDVKLERDYQYIRQYLISLISNGARILDIKIISASSLPSSLIGYFLKLLHKDKIDLSIGVGNDRLYALFAELGLLDELKISYFGE
ncbi:MAG: hypothetical protein ACTTJS_00785 [Wolinella sp.]